jgi:hypothetical protein
MDHPNEDRSIPSFQPPTTMRLGLLSINMAKTAPYILLGAKLSQVG